MGVASSDRQLWMGNSTTKRKKTLHKKINNNDGWSWYKHTNIKTADFWVVVVNSLGLCTLCERERERGGGLHVWLSTALRDPLQVQFVERTDVGGQRGHGCVGGEETFAKSGQGSVAEGHGQRSSSGPRLWREVHCVSCGACLHGSWLWILVNVVEMMTLDVSYMYLWLTVGMTSGFKDYITTRYL